MVSTGPLASPIMGFKRQSSTAVLRSNFCAKLKDLGFDFPNIAKRRNVGGICVNSAKPNGNK